MLDVTAYAVNLSSSTYQTSGPIWREYYYAKSAYGPLVTPNIADDAAAELTPVWWHNVTVALERNQSAFEAYYARKSRGWNVAACRRSCVSAEICQLRAARSQDNCVEVTLGIDFRKRGVDEKGMVERDVVKGRGSAEGVRSRGS